MYRLQRNRNASIDGGSESVRPGAGAFTHCTCFIASISILLSGLIFLATPGRAQPVRAGAHPHFEDADLAALHEYARQVGVEQPKLASLKESHNRDPHFDDPDLAAMREYAQQIGAGQPNSGGAPRLKVAEADNALDALRDFFRRGSEPEATPGPPPKQSTPVAPRYPRPATPRPEPRFIDAKYVGVKTCLYCHASQAELFSKTLMGRIARTQQPGKLDCENCHGPGSAHVQAVGCAACHGDGGVTTRPGIPNLVGQDPQYLVPAMKAYITGQRKHELKKALLTGVGEAELHNIANYYARQIPAPARTPLIGDPAAGKKATALCAGCHGDHGIAEVPAWPNLAGQDSTYLVDAIEAYKRGTRSKAIACAACHGEGGISKTSGTPSLVGIDPQYLVVAMKAYTNGQRKHDLMAALLAGVGDTELNSIANYYARQTPARARTSTVGDAAAGKTASAACSGCHGEQGVSANPAWPSLAGQDAQYLADAMRAYKDGSRTDATMKALLASVDERTINDMAAYYASLAPGRPSPTSGPAAARDPVVVRNNLVASLSGRTIANVASYYASLRPAQIHSAKQAPGRADPVLVTRPAPTGGLSLGGIVSFRTNDPGRSAEENNAICLTCHDKGQRTNWHGSTHDQQNLQCSNCHTVMKNVSRKAQLKTEFQPDTCFQCHKNKRAEMWRTSHIPVREGKVTCTNCHNPHGSYSEALLKTATVNEVCYQCHAEKRGPFLWEHPPVSESCLNCHDPHGSNNDFLLKISRPRLCQQCHSGGQHNSNPRNPSVTLYAQGRECQNCHSNHHGSNNPAGARFMR